jgi:hypothetical protein
MRRLLPQAITAVVLAAVAGCGDGGGDRLARDCGTRSLYGHALRLHVVGRRLPCSRVRRIAAGKCDPAHDRDGWACFSFRPPSPVLVWFRERERFRRDWSTAIEGRRPPCSEARVAPAQWRRAIDSHYNSFPTPAQVLGDDLIRCHQLRGMTRAEVFAALGGRDRGGRYLDFPLGDERDSFMQVDSESFVIEFSRGRFRSASWHQN